MAAIGIARSMTRPGAAKIGGLVFRPLNSVRRSPRERRVLVFAVLSLTGALLVAMLWFVWLRLRVVEVAYRISAVRHVVARLDGERRELEAEVAALESPRRLEEKGRKLGMAPPQWGEEVPLP